MNGNNTTLFTYSLTASLQNITTPTSTDKEFEYEPINQFVFILMMAIDVFLVLFCCSGNLFTIVTVFYVPTLRTFSNRYIISLAVTDFFTGIMIPIYSTDLYVPYRRLLDNSKYFCLVRIMFLYTFITHSILCITAIACDRFIFIKYPLRHLQIFTPLSVNISLGCMWLLSFIIGSIPLYCNNWDSRTRCESFSLLPVGYRLGFLCPGFFICCCVTIGFYASIVHEAIPQERRQSQLSTVYKLSVGDQNHQQQIQQQQQQHQQHQHHHHHLHLHWLNHEEMKSVKMFMLVFGVFFLCWTPSFVLMALGYFVHINLILQRACLILGYLNSGMNFIIYAFKNTLFNHAFQSFVQMHWSASTSAIVTGASSTGKQVTNESHAKIWTCSCIK